MNFIRLPLLVAFFGSSVWISCKSVSPGSSDAQATSLESTAENLCKHGVSLATLGNVTWEQRREACEKALNAYLQEKKVGYEQMAESALGRGGIPFMLLRIMPDFDPETWGSPQDRFARFGFFYDERYPDRILPTGLAWSKALLPEEVSLTHPNFDAVTLSCGACHIGRVRGDNGKIEYIDGGVNTQLDINQWRMAFPKSMAKYLVSETKMLEGALKIAGLIATKPIGFFYGSTGTWPSGYELKQRALFSNPIFLVALLKKAALRFAVERAVTEKRIAVSYSVGESAKYLAGGTPGSVDAIGNSIYRVLGQKHFGNVTKMEEVTSKVASFKTAEFEAAPKFPTPSDFMSVWGQEHRSIAQWNGDLKHTFWRNLAAQLGVIGDPSKVDMSITATVAQMMHRLPPKPYPFAVDMAKALRGEVLFDKNCLGCHRQEPGSTRVYSETNTDANKAKMINPAAAEIVIGSLRAVCTDPEFTTVGISGGPAEKPCAMADDDIVIGRFTPETQGYAASPLDGIWARAPYLHNGSVPTLRHLLSAKDRPSTFVRGAISYDQERVGWSWDVAKYVELKKENQSAGIFQTQWAGFSNRGHNTNIVLNGKTHILDWSALEYAGDLEDLLEYMKTL